MKSRIERFKKNYSSSRPEQQKQLICIYMPFHIHTSRHSPMAHHLRPSPYSNPNVAAFLQLPERLYKTPHINPHNNLHSLTVATNCHNHDASTAMNCHTGSSPLRSLLHYRSQRLTTITIDADTAFQDQQGAREWPESSAILESGRPGIHLRTQVCARCSSTSWG